MLVVSLFIVLLIQPSFAKKKTTPRFKEHSIIAPFKLTHSLMAIDLLPTAGKEIVTFSVDDFDNRWLMVYSYDEETTSYMEVDRQQLPKTLYSFDITKPVDNQLQTLYFLSINSLSSDSISSNSLYRYSIQNATESRFKAIKEISSFAMGGGNQYLAKGEFLVDLNNDKLVDIYLPDFKNIHILTAQSDGTFKSQSLPIKPQVELSNNSAKYTQTQLYFSDVNFDQLIDIIKVGEGEFEYFLQNADQSFSQQPHIQPLNKLISGIDWWNKRSADGEELDQSNLAYKKVEQFKDINNDGIIDMVVRHTRSSGVLDRSNDYEIYLGINKLGLLTYNDEPNSTIKADGTLTGFKFVDIDNDNKYEVVLAGFDIGLSQIIGALLSSSIDQDVYLFKMDEEGNFDPDRNISKEVELSFSISSGTSGSPVVELADINGDGLKDLLLSQGDSKLRIYMGVRSKRLFARRAEKHKMLIPKQGDMFGTEDINGDGKADVLIKYGREDDKKLERIFKVLLAI